MKTKIKILSHLAKSKFDCCVRMYMELVWGIMQLDNIYFHLQHEKYMYMVTRVYVQKVTVIVNNKPE